MKQSVSDGLHLGIRRNTYQNDGNFSGAVQAVLFHHQVASRTRDLAICDQSLSSGLFLSEMGNQELNDEPERLVEKAKVKEYIFTGSREQDIHALHDYIEACNKAIHALDPANREARTLARLKLRMDVTILRESLKEELEVYRRVRIDPFVLTRARS